MAKGSVIRYDGARGVVWRIKFPDATGRQVMETLGAEADGWTRTKAERELRHRLTDVERTGWRKPDRLTFSAFADRFLDEHLPGRGLKPTTLQNYRADVELHLRPALGHLDLTEITPETIDRYVTEKARAGLSPKTITNHLLLLGSMLKRAQRWRLIASNPVDAVDRPKLRRPEIHVLTEAQVARLWAAYRELHDQADERERVWWRLARTVTFVALGTGLRRGELLALRWRDVALLEGRLTVREAYVRGRFTTPKSDASRRTIDLGPRTVELLQEHWQATSYRGDGELVLGHPTKGTPADGSKLAKIMRAALAHAGIDGVTPWHGMRHSALTHAAAAGAPALYVQHRAGHAQASMTERYLHAAQVMFEGAAEASEARIFGALR